MGAGCNRVAVKVDMNLVFDGVGFCCLSALYPAVYKGRTFQACCPDGNLC